MMGKDERLEFRKLRLKDKAVMQVWAELGEKNV